MFPAPATLGKHVSSKKRPYFDGYAGMNECGTVQLIIVVGSAIVAGMLWLNLNYERKPLAGMLNEGRGRTIKPCVSLWAGIKRMKRFFHMLKVIACEDSSCHVNIYSG